MHRKGQSNLGVEGATTSNKLATQGKAKSHKYSNKKGDRFRKSLAKRS
jgi:hypothetical protein